MGLLGHLANYDGLQQTLVERSDGTIDVRTQSDVSALIKENKRLYGLNDGYSESRDFRRVASIPLVLIHAWHKKGIEIANPEHWPKIAAALDSKEFAFLRTAPGRISKAPKREYFSGTGSRGAKENLEL